MDLKNEIKVVENELKEQLNKYKQNKLEEDYLFQIPNV